MELTVAQLAERLGAEVSANQDERNKVVKGVGPVVGACETDITFITDSRHISELSKSRAAAVIVSKRIENLLKPQLIVSDVNTTLISALSIFAPKLKPASEGINPAAKVGKKVEINETASIGPGVVIDDNVKISANTVIASGCRIGENSIVGRNCRFDTNVVVYHNCVIGNDVIIQANSTIGSSGFGYFFIDGSHRLVPHNGGVVIEDFVEIGANTCIDRAKFGNTIIGAGTKIDNLVHIAHNVVIGKCCLITGQVGISGSCKIGNDVVLAGQVGLVDNIEIGDGVVIGAQAGVTRNVAAGSQVFGSPAIDAKEAVKVVTLTKRLPKMYEQLKRLNNRIDNLEASEDNKKRM